MTTSPVASITDDLLAELEQLAGKATPGPWQHVPGDDDPDSSWSMQFPIVTSDIREVIGTEGFYSEKDIDEANAAFVASANPATILALLQHVRELTKDRERLDNLDKLCEAYGFEVHEGNRWVLDGPFRNVRDAIDSLPDDADRSSTNSSGDES
jgi:hypothetical protein